MPAGATFNRLNEVIQSVTNFQGYHLFEFDLSEDNIRVTNDEETYQEHKHFMKNRKAVEEEMEKNVSPECAKFQEAQLTDLNTVIRKPTAVKIDTYIEIFSTLF